MVDNHTGKIIELVKINLMKRKHKVNIVNDLKISSQRLLSVSSGHSALQCSNKVRKRVSSTDGEIKQALQVVGKGGN